MDIVDSDTLKNLVELQKLDSEILEIRGSLERTPEIRKHRGGQVERLEGALKQKREDLKQLRMRSHEIEVEIQAKDAAIAKALTQLNTAKTNDEYHGLKDQAARFEIEKGKAEDVGLELLEAIDMQEGDEKNLLEELEVARREFQGFSEQLDRDTKSFEEDLTKIEGRRKEMATKIADDALKFYERVLNAREGLAVVAVNGRICQGCYVTITSNDLMHMRTGRRLVVCSSCQRILFEGEEAHA